MPQATATLSRSTTAAIAGTAAAMPDIATVNTSGRITTVVRPITAIICPTTVLIGPVRAIIGRVTRTIGHMPAIIGGLTATLRFTGITSGRVRFDESMGVGTSMNGRVLLTGEGLNDAETVNTMDPAKPEIIPIYIFRDRVFWPCDDEHPDWMAIFKDTS